VKTRAFLVLACVFIAASASATGEYRSIDVESMRVTIDSEWGSRTTPGYLPVRFDITNFGEARVIEILGQGSRVFRTMRGFQQGGIVVRQALRLARAERVRITLPVPIAAANESIRFEIREDGKTLERFNYTGFQSGTPSANASALIVADPSSAFSLAAAGWPRTMAGPTGGYSPAGRLLDFVLEPSRLPTNWLGFTSVRAVVIGPKEWEQLSEPQKEALRTWTACGGDLFFVDGEMAAIFPGRPAFAPSGDRAATAHFFGRIHLPTSGAITAAGLAKTLTDATPLQDANWALPANRAADWGTIAARGFRLPIPGVAGVPARAYLSILIVFTLLIGPVNYWILWRKRRQVLLVLTAPVISAGFILLLAGYVLAGEGLGVRGRAMTFTMLDQASKQAVTRVSASLYAAGMTPGGGLNFGRDVAVYAIGPDGSGSRDQQTLDLTEAQRYTAGMIQARSPTNLEQVSFRPARERLSFNRDGAGMTVVNGLDVTVAALLYKDGDTVYSLARPLPAGGRDTLIAGAATGRIQVPPDMPLAARFAYLIAHQPRGSYLAVLERSPFWDVGVSGVAERSSFHFMIGWPDGQPAQQ
jgi:hypothetical protein